MQTICFLGIPKNPITPRWRNHFWNPRSCDFHDDFQTYSHDDFQISVQTLTGNRTTISLYLEASDINVIPDSSPILYSMQAPLNSYHVAMVRNMNFSFRVAFFHRFLRLGARSGFLMLVSCTAVRGCLGWRIEEVFRLQCQLCPYLEDAG